MAKCTGGAWLSTEKRPHLEVNKQELRMVVLGEGHTQLQCGFQIPS